MNSLPQFANNYAQKTFLFKPLEPCKFLAIRSLSFKMTPRQRNVEDLFRHKKVQHTGGKEFALVFGTFAGACSLVCLYIYGDMLITSSYNHYRGIMSADWKPALGVISRTDITHQTLLTSKFSHIYKPHVMYTYKVDNNYFAGDKFRFSEDLRNTENQAKAQISGFKPGQNVVVYYDPNNPSDSVLVKGPQNQTAELLMSTTGVGIGSFMLYVSVHLLRPRQMVRDFMAVFRKQKL